MNQTISDVAQALRQFEIWSTLTHFELSRRFRRSKLGILWLILQHLVFVCGIGVIWARLFGMDMRWFIPFVSAGLSVWTFMSSSFVNGNQTFIVSRGYITQLPHNHIVFVAQTTYTNLIILAISLTTTVILAILLLPGGIKIGIFAAIPGIALTVVAGFVTSLAFAYLGARFRDIQHGLPLLFQMLFVLTPIIYPPSVMKERGLDFALYLNPFAGFIEIIRAPILEGRFADGGHYIAVLVFIACLASLAALLDRAWKQRVVFWL